MKANLTLRLRRSYPWLQPCYADGDGQGGGGDAGGQGGGQGGGSGGGKEGQGGGANGGAGGAQGGGAAGGGAGDDDDKPKFNQKHVNKLLAEERRKNEEKTKNAIAQLEEVRKQKGLDIQAKQDLESRIEELQNSLMTKEEQAKKELEKKEKLLKTTTEGLTLEREFWRTQFSTEATRNQIAKAAGAHKAVNAEQMEELLMPKTRLVEVAGEDEKAPKKYIPKVQFKSKNDKGEDITLDLTIEEAVKWMKDQPERFGNLFESGLNGGLGGGGSSGGAGNLTGEKPPSDPNQYRLWRKNKGLAGRSR